MQLLGILNMVLQTFLQENWDEPSKRGQRSEDDGAEAPSPGGPGGIKHDDPFLRLLVHVVHENKAVIDHHSGESDDAEEAEGAQALTGKEVAANAPPSASPSWCRKRLSSMKRPPISRPKSRPC